MDTQLPPILPKARNLLIYVIGCPASAKGTICRYTSQDYHCLHLSTGDLLRSLKDDPKYQDRVASYVQEGTLVPTETVVDILFQATNSRRDVGHAVIVDGFPRTVEQALYAEKLLGTPDLVFFFDCKKSTALERYLTRKLEGRLDDTEQMFHRRYNEFERCNPAVVEYYYRRGLLLHINTTDEPKVSYVKLVAVLKGDKRWKREEKPKEKVKKESQVVTILETEIF